MRRYVIVKEQSRTCPSTIRFIFDVKPDPSFKKKFKIKKCSTKLKIELGAATTYFMEPIRRNVQSLYDAYFLVNDFYIKTHVMII
ncbi:hypothetical protein BSK66_24775 [Paenibacillus odorifer]|nr:hypothetical protein C171_11736 [Paenibacillus sp. FSL H8-237]OME50684.1 hypothetical protein BSK66_24775 [Paenibacillus odorifer]